MRLRRLSLRYLFFVAMALGAALAAGAQEKGSVRVNIQVPDSVAHVVDRQSAAQSAFAIVSRDGTAALLLLDTTIVAQMTDHGLARMNSRATMDTIKGAVSRLLARMALGALTPLFDHGIAYHLRDMGDARYADGRLQLIRAKGGKEVFRDTLIGNTPLMESFTPSDAIEFAKRAKAARAKLPEPRR